MAMDQLPGFENCHDCDRVVVEAWKYCPACGAELDVEVEHVRGPEQAVLPGENEDPELNESDLVSVDETDDGPPHPDEAEELFDAENTFDVTPEGVIEALEANGGELPQADFTDVLESYPSKVSMLLSDMESDGQIERERMEGRHAGKVVRLPDAQEASADPDDDAPDASEDDPELEDLNTDPEELDLSEYGQTGQKITPELLIGALEGAQAVYQVKRHLRLADREVEEILRKLGLFEELRDGSSKLNRATAEHYVRKAVDG